MDFTNVSQNYEAGTKVLASQFVFGLSRKTQWLSGLYYADFISFYSPTQLCGGGTTKSNSNELPISVPFSFFILLPSLLWYTESDNMIGASDEKDPLSIFRLSVRTGWRWEPSRRLATLPCSRL